MIRWATSLLRGSDLDCHWNAPNHLTPKIITTTVAAFISWLYRNPCSKNWTEPANEGGDDVILTTSCNLLTNSYPDFSNILYLLYTFLFLGIWSSKIDDIIGWRKDYCLLNQWNTSVDRTILLISKLLIISKILSLLTCYMFGRNNILITLSLCLWLWQLKQCIFLWPLTRQVSARLSSLDRSCWHCSRHFNSTQWVGVGWVCIPQHAFLAGGFS